MDKKEAIRLLGGTPSAAAKAIGISVAAVSLWPEVLTERITDRVQAALYRAEQAKTRPRTAGKPKGKRPQVTA